MKGVIIVCALWFFQGQIQAQELYVFTEPASNMPSRSLGFKLTAKYPTRAGTSLQRYKPELMFGINKNWMVHVSSTLSDYYQEKVRFESGKLYAKYRFYSNDEVHRHFRMAAFADVGYSRNPYKYMDANLDGDNSGAQVGLIATQLVNKLAVSASASYLGIFKDDQGEQHHNDYAYNMLNYTLSAGYLLLPVEYVNYNQVNVNLYLELLGMKALDQNHYGADLAPAVQFIFNSNTKVNLGYRFQLKGNMKRIANQQVLIALEHTLFNAWK